MANRIDLFREFMTHQTEGRLDDAIAMLADIVVMNEPMTGTSTGKAAVEAVMRGRPPGGGDMGMTWSEPEEHGDAVTLVGSGGPFPIQVAVSFDASNKINKIDIGVA
jgi:hypothetical protein